MSIENFKTLLESSDGLTDEFKSYAVEAIQTLVSESLETQKKELEEAHTAELGKQLSEQLEAQAETLKAEYTAQIEKLSESLAESTQEIANLKESHEADFKALEEQLEELAEAKADEKLADLSEKLDYYTEQEIKKGLEEAKAQTVDAIKLELAESFMRSLKDLMESYSLHTAEGTKALEEKIEELKNENDSMYKMMNESLEESRKLTAELESVKRSHLLEKVSADMADTQKVVFESTVDAFKDLPSFEDFKAKVELVAEGFKKEAPVEPKATPSVVVTESVPKVEEPKSEPTKQELDEDVRWVAQAIMRGNRN